MRLLSMFLLLTFFGLGHCQPNCSYQNLFSSLNLSSNSVTVRPTSDWRVPTTVLLDVTLYSVVNLDMNLQSLTSYVWFYMSWNNSFLSWTPEENCGITKMLVPADSSWKPDIYIYELTETDDKSPVIPFYKIHSSGKVSVSKPLRIISTCNLDISRFPFDTQYCLLSFGSYVYSEVDVLMLPRYNSSVTNTNSQAVFASKGDWTLKDVSVFTTTLEFSAGSFSIVRYQISIKRTPLIYIINLIVPAFFMVLVDVFSMFIKCYTERLSFKITVVLGFSVLLLILNDMMPNSDNTPIFGIFCCVVMAMMIFSILGCVLANTLLELSYKYTHVPPWMKTLCLCCLANILCVKPKGTKKDLVTVIYSNKDSEEIDKKPSTEQQSMKRKDFHNQSKVSMEVKLLKRILVEITKITDELLSTNKTDHMESEWYTAALIVDRLIFIIYIIIIVTIFLIVIILWSQ
ncbi:5-hydroxytryptamine receptor 3A-like [Pelodytes ibericus]